MLFGGKRKPSEADKTKAANIFATRDSQTPATTVPVNEGVESRIFDYTKVKGAEEVRKTKEEKLEERKKAKEVNIQDHAAINKATWERKNNLVYGIKVEAKNKLTNEEQKELDKKGMDKLEDVVDRIKNKGFITEVKPESRNVNKTLTDEEIRAATAKIRNQGFFTETKTTARTLTKEQKAKKDMDDKISAEKAMAALMGASFYRKKQEEPEGEGENK